MEADQGDEGVGFRRVCFWVGGQHPAEAEGFAAEVFAEDGVVGGGVVAFVEQQVDDVKDVVEPAGYLVGRGHFEPELEVA